MGARAGGRRRGERAAFMYGTRYNQKSAAALALRHQDEQGGLSRRRKEPALLSVRRCASRATFHRGPAKFLRDTHSRILPRRLAQLKDDSHRAPVLVVAHLGQLVTVALEIEHRLLKEYADADVRLITPPPAAASGHKMDALRTVWRLSGRRRR